MRIALASTRHVLMMNVEDVHRCLDEGRNALVHLAEFSVTGERARGEVYEQAQAEHDALVSLLDESPASEHATTAAAL